MEGTHGHTTAIGTISGTALTILVNIGSQDVFKTIVLAAIGAIVSFCVTVSLKWIVKKIKNVSSR